MFWTCCHWMEWYYHALDNLITFIIKPCMCFSFESCLIQRIQWLPPWIACHLIHVTKSISLFVNPLNIIKTIKFLHLWSLFQSQKLFTWNHVQLPHLSFTKPWLEFSLISLFALRALVKSLRSSDWLQSCTIWYTFQKCFWFQCLTSLTTFFPY